MFSAKSCRRGFYPDDYIDFNGKALGCIKQAAEDICWLLNRGYDIRQAVTFAGNHYSLKERQRLALVRALASDRRLAERLRKQVTSVHMDRIAVDGFNTIITLETALSHSPVFFCRDGTVRDLAGLHGTYRIIDKTYKAVQLVFDSLKENGVSAALFFLDRQVSNSGRLKSFIAEIAEAAAFPVWIELVPDVDMQLIKEPVVISSDSVVLDKCTSWYNLVRSIIEEYLPDTWIVRL
jgi:hypothetical protein